VVRQRVLGPEHPGTLVTAMNLASALVQQGKYAEAETLYSDVLEAQQRVLGSEHPNTLMTANNLAALSARRAQAMGKHAEARQ